MQKIFRKIFMFFFSVTMCMSGFLSQSIVQASAETITITGTNGLHGVADMSPSSKWTVSLPGTTYGVLMHVGITIAGHHAYCIEPYSDLAFDYYGNGTTNYTAKDLGTYFGNAETTQRLSEICYYGYGYDGDTAYDMDWATQIRIWQELGAPIGDIHPDIQAKIDQINEKLRICETKVSFFGEEVTLQGYGKENAATFTDENGVFQYYVDWKIEGIHSERNGNTLTVWAEPGDSLDTILDYNCCYLAHQDNNASHQVHKQ